MDFHVSASYSMSSRSCGLSAAASARAVGGVVEKESSALVRTVFAT
jgi:hypothetical protein